MWPGRDGTRGPSKKEMNEFIGAVCRNCDYYIECNVDGSFYMTVTVRTYSGIDLNARKFTSAISVWTDAHIKCHMGRAHGLTANNDDELE